MKPLTLQWNETPDQENRQCITVQLADQIGDILPLTGALGGGGIILSEFARPLMAKNGVPVHTGQGIGHVILDANAVAATAGLSVNDIAADTRGRPWLEGQRQAIAFGTSPGGQYRHDRARPSVSAVNAMAPESQELMSVLLRSQSSGFIFSAVHNAVALVAEARHGGHVVTALAGLQGGRRAL